MSFDDFNLSDNLLRGIYSYGFEKPSEVQQRAILPMVNKNNLIVQAQSGTGKTATFSIGVLQQLDPNIKSVAYDKKRAIDVSVKNKTPQQILDFMKLARSQGYRVLDERVRPKGQKKWDGAHLHLDFKKGGQFGGQVMEMDEDEITQFLKAGGQLEFLD